MYLIHTNYNANKQAPRRSHGYVMTHGFQRIRCKCHPHFFDRSGPFNKFNAWMNHSMKPHQLEFMISWWHGPFLNTGELFFSFTFLQCYFKTQIVTKKTRFESFFNTRSSIKLLRYQTKFQHVSSMNWFASWLLDLFANLFATFE